MTVSPGQVAYEAYVRHSVGGTVQAESLPGYLDEDPVTRGHWEYAAQAVLGGLESEEA